MDGMGGTPGLGAARPAGRSPAMKAKRRFRVLLIEDDAEFAELYQMSLRARACEVEWALDGERGLDIAARGEIDLVVLDMRLPGMDGVEVLRRLRALSGCEDLPIVIVSNYGDAQQRRRGRELGALDWIDKVDTTPTDLSGWIRDCLIHQPPDGR